MVMKDSSALSDSLPLSDSAAAIDSAAADTIPVGERNDGVIFLGHQQGLDAPLRADTRTAGSWLLLAVIALICLVCARYKSNFKYLKQLLHNLTSVRERENLFDDTAKETSFMILLNMLCAVTVGLLLFVGLAASDAIPPDPADITADVWTCIIAVGIYCFLMPAAYYIAGIIFSDITHTRLWVRGFLASQAILGIMLMLPALAALFYPAAALPIVAAAAIIFLIIKIIFITKSFRIFFSHFSSWVLFLYYLCILEFIPPIATILAILQFAA